MAQGDKAAYDAKFAAAVPQNQLDEFLDQRKEDAETAGVSKPEYIDYAEKMARYQARPDTETLADVRARESGETFSDTDFARHKDYTGVSEEVETSRGAVAEEESPTSP